VKFTDAQCQQNAEYEANGGKCLTAGKDCCLLKVVIFEVRQKMSEQLQGQYVTGNWTSGGEYVQGENVSFSQNRPNVDL